MSKGFKKFLWLVLPVFLGIFAVGLTNQAEAASSGQQNIYRLYNPNSGEHFYTSNTSERWGLVRAGWHNEGVGWVAPQKSDSPVYRLYNPNAGDHHYTLSASERDGLVNAGWKTEGVNWYSDDARTAPVYRAYNPNAVAGSHNYTTSSSEQNHIVSVGWRDEGHGWYAISATGSEPNVPITQDDGYVSIEAVMNLSGTGGYHSKVMINSKGGGTVASFGIQVDPDNARFPNQPAYLLENIKSNAAEAGPVGKEYLFIQQAGLKQDIKVRLSWHQDQTLKAYVNDVQIAETKGNLTGPFTFGAEASVRKRDESVDAYLKDVTVKAGNPNDPSHLGIIKAAKDGWNNDDFNFFGLRADLIKEGTVHNSNDAFTTNDAKLYKPSFRIHGTANIAPGYDWDTSFQLPGGHPLSGLAMVAQRQ